MGTFQTVHRRSLVAKHGDTLFRWFLKACNETACMEIPRNLFSMGTTVGDFDGETFTENPNGKFELWKAEWNEQTAR